VTNWKWSDPQWKLAVGEDLDAAVREALRRSVHLRDELAESGSGATTEAVFLVDAMNHLAELLGADVENLWDRT
jgi:hypothetical protein